MRISDWSSDVCSSDLFDIDAQRIAQLHEHHDHTLELSADELKAAGKLEFASDPQALAGCNVFIVTVPTPIDDYKRPDLRPLESASRTVGRALASGAVDISQSTVSPTATADVFVLYPHGESAHGFH